MKWAIVGSIESGSGEHVWGVREFENKADAVEFATGLAKLIHKESGEWLEQDPGAGFADLNDMSESVRYTVLPLAEEFEAPHDQSGQEYVVFATEEDDEEEDVVNLSTSSAYEMPALGWYGAGSIEMAEEGELDEVSGYVAVARGTPRPGRDAGWYTSVTIDTEHSMHDLWIDVGPYDSAMAAMRDGADAVIEWGINNDLYMGHVENLDSEFEDWLNHRFDDWRD